MEEEACGMGLSLELGLGKGGGGGGGGVRRKERDRKTPVQFHILFPTTQDGDHEGEEEEEEEEEEGSAKGGARKKLRLSKDQSSLLEDHFRCHTTLNLIQKTELAHRLNLLPRQVEVWFQNRRARTKLKQTEVDCGFLRKYCESLSDENRRLKVELMELRSMMNSSVGGGGAPSPLIYMQTLAKTYMCCPSCQKLPVLDGGGGGCDKSKSGSGDSETSFDHIAAVAPNPTTTTTGGGVKEYHYSSSSSMACCR